MGSAYPPDRLRGLKRGNTVNVGRKPKPVQDHAAAVFTPEGFAKYREKWSRGELEPAAMTVIAKMAGLLVERKDLHFPDGVPTQRVIHVFPPKGEAA